MEINELMIRYKSYVGIDMMDTTIPKDENHMIYRYARILAFWKKEKHCIATKSYDNVMKKINKEYNRKIRGKIMNLVNTFIDDVRNQKIERIKKKLKIIYALSQKYYKDTKDNVGENEEKYLCDPDSWIANQNIIRNAWERFTEESGKDVNVWNEMMCNSFCKYMQFMYESFPAGYKDGIEKLYEETGYVDASEVYYNLSIENKITNSLPCMNDELI